MFFVTDSKTIADQYSMSNIKYCIAVIRSFAIKCLCVKKIATIPSELVKIIIVAHRGDACKYIASSFREFQGQQIVFLLLCAKHWILLLILCYFFVFICNFIPFII